MLPDRELRVLRDKGFKYEQTDEGGHTCVVIHDFPLPPGYSNGATELLLRLPPGFPDARPDMFWCDPPVTFAGTGAYPQAADNFEPHLGRQWQRFSRHLAEGQWRPGIDGLESYLALIRRDLARTGAVAA